MSLINIEKTITLDVYDHDTTPSVVKAIQLDKGTRTVYAGIQNSRQDYDIGQNATVILTVLRPDKTKVQIIGETFVSYTGADGTMYGAKAELSDVALAVKGNLKAQFKITSGEQELRTEVFTVNTGEALDAGDGDWAGDLDGHNLDEMAESIETLQTDMAAVNEDVSDLKEGLNELPNIVEPQEDDADLYICDENGNVIAEFADGHVKTKNFDSSDTNIVKDSSDTETDLYICDTFGNVIAKLVGGHVVTKEFDSSNVVSNLSAMSDRIDGNTQKINALERINVRMKFGAHNGAEWYAPECTIPAYRIAGQQGWEWAWIAGIYFSSEGSMYVLHDGTVDRTTDGTGSISSMTDAQIDALHIDQSGGTRYNLSDFDPAELIIPTLEQVVQQCVLYDMKMVFRLDSFPKSYTETDAVARWDGLVNLLKAYNVLPTDISCYVVTGTVADICRNLFGAEVEISTFLGRTAVAQDFIDWFSERNITGNRAAIININNVDLASVKLLHSNGIRVYAYDESPSEEHAFMCASLGVDIYQNAKIYRIVEEG